MRLRGWLGLWDSSPAPGEERSSSSHCSFNLGPGMRDMQSRAVSHPQPGAVTTASCRLMSPLLEDTEVWGLLVTQHPHRKVTTPSGPLCLYTLFEKHLLTP